MKDTLGTNLIEILENTTINFFPKDGRWKSSAYRKSEDSLICHLRDNEWLAKRLQEEQNLENIDFNKILTFVKTSEFFKEKRHEYEQKIVKWQIE